MSLTDDEVSRRLRTRILNFHRDEKEPILKRRQARIDEAVSFEKGRGTDNPERYVIDTLPSGVEVFFLKPGKEADRSGGNPEDMTPGVGDLYEGYQFADTWADITRLGFADLSGFKNFLVLVYRNAYLFDHEDEGDGRWRYQPDEEVVSTIDAAAGKAIDGTVLSLLHFLDLLAWNEDVKYQYFKDYDMYGSDFYQGRLNTLLTCIKIPYRLYRFIENDVLVAESLDDVNIKDYVLTVQDLSIGRGVSKPTNGELENWFSPTLNMSNQGTHLSDF